MLHVYKVWTHFKRTNTPDLSSASVKVDQINIFIKIFFSDNTPVHIETWIFITDIYQDQRMDFNFLQKL